jgi:tetratricopeptide (TPR) repeat protein
MLQDFLLAEDTSFRVLSFMTAEEVARLYTSTHAPLFDMCGYAEWVALGARMPLPLPMCECHCLRLRCFYELANALLSAKALHAAGAYSDVVKLLEPYFEENTVVTLPPQQKAHLLSLLGQAYSEREKQKIYAARTDIKNILKAIETFEEAVDIWDNLPEADIDVEALATALSALSVNYSKSIDQVRLGFPGRFPKGANGERKSAREILERAEKAARQAVTMYASLDHPKLGSALKDMGTFYRRAYMRDNMRTDLSTSADVDLPQQNDHERRETIEHNMDQAIDFYKAGAATFEKTGLDNRDLDYGACLYNIGLVCWDKSSHLQAVQWFVKAIIASDRCVGTEHPRSIMLRTSLGKDLCVLLLRKRTTLEEILAVLETSQMVCIVKVLIVTHMENFTAGEDAADDSDTTETESEEEDPMVEDDTLMDEVPLDEGPLHEVTMVDVTA